MCTTKKYIKNSTLWPWAYFTNGPNAAASIAPTLIRHWQSYYISRPNLCICAIDVSIWVISYCYATAPVLLTYFIHCRRLGGGCNYRSALFPAASWNKRQSALVLPTSAKKQSAQRTCQKCNWQLWTNRLSDVLACLTVVVLNDKTAFKRILYCIV